jgi:hypothetical protein
MMIFPSGQMPEGSISGLPASPGTARSSGRPAFWRRSGPIDPRTFVTLASIWLLIYSAWLTSIVFCSVNSLRPLLIAAAVFFPIGVVHGIGVWFGGW